MQAEKRNGDLKCSCGAYAQSNRMRNQLWALIACEGELARERVRKAWLEYAMRRIQHHVIIYQLFRAPELKLKGVFRKAFSTGRCIQGAHGGRARQRYLAALAVAAKIEEVDRRAQRA